MLSFIQRYALLMSGVSVLALASPLAFAATSGGVDTPSGVQTLPLAVEGNPIITLSDTPANTATVAGNLTATTTTTTVAGVTTTSGGQIQPAGFADDAQPSCGTTNQGALIYSTTQNTELVCNGAKGKWELALSGSAGRYLFVASSSGPIIDEIDTSTGALYVYLNGTWSLYIRPLNPSGTVAGRYLFVASSSGPIIDEIDTSTGALYVYLNGTWSLYIRPLP